MEHVAGSSLRALLDQEGKLATARAVSVAADACSGLAAAHRIGLVHGDLRPGSIMVTRDLAKVSNFGVRAPAGDATPAAVTATARYAAPELIQGAGVDGRSDLYALGCCLYEMLTGEPPFDGPSPVAIAYRHVREEPQPPSRKRRGVPAALDAITLRALAKDPGDRFQGAVDMGAALERAAQA
jgi:serine/threonine-protein kinase